MPTVALSQPEVLAFIVIPVALLALLVWGVYATSGAGKALLIAFVVSAWMIFTWRLGGSGVLRQWSDTPPPFMLLVVAIIVIANAIAFGPVGRRLAVGVPLWALVATQGFRLPLELAMHRLAERGLMPEQMTFTGRNFDILTGASALIVAALLVAGRAGRRTVWVWNVAGTLLLVNIVVVAILSTPRFAYFGADRLNVFVTYTPFVWLPTVMVLAALAGHLLIYRRLFLTAGRT